MIFIIIFILFQQGIAQENIEDTFVERGRYLVAFQDSVNHTYYHKSLERWKQDVIFSGYIESPFENSKFYRYYSKWMSPSPLKLLSSYEDTIFFLPPHNPKINFFPGVDSSTINFLNQRLLKESEFSIDKIEELALFYNKLMDPGVNSRKVLNSWREIVFAKKDTISEEIKNKIQPLSVTYNNQEYHVKFYVWLKYGRDLYEIKLTYRNKSFTINSILLGKFGKSYAFM